MIIPKKNVDKFLARPREDWSFVKELKFREINRMMRKECKVRPPIWKALRKHQRVCLILGAMFGFFGFFLDTGMGKTLLSIALGLYHRAAGNLQPGEKVLVLVPNKINKATWAREFRKWAKKLKRPSLRREYLVLEGSSEEKWQQLEESDALFVIETYGGFFNMLCKKVPVKKKGKVVKKKGKVVQKLSPVRSRVERARRIFKGLTLDESTNVQTKSSLPARLARQIRKDAIMLLILTGTPFGRDPTALWSQIFLIDQGYTLGETLGLFRAAFFKEKRGFFGGYEYTFKKEMEPELNEFLKNCTIRYEVDASDLPQFIPVERIIKLPDDAEVYAERALEALKESRRNADLRATLNSFIRLRQISSGWVGYADDETGEKAELVFPENPKLDLLVSDLQSLNEKAIVFHDFIFSGDLIEKALTKVGISWCRISGKTKDHEAILSRFDSKKGPQVLILNNKFSMGPNLQAARYGMTFEAPCSCILRFQGRRRFERQGSSFKKVFGYDYITLGTYDRRILDFHEEGKDLREAILEGVKKRRKSKGSRGRK